MRAKSLLSLVIVALLLFCVNCREGPHRVADERPEQPDKASPAFKAGEAAHDLAKGAARAAEAAGRKIDEGARRAREGWKEKEKEDREKQRDHAAGRM